MSSSRPDQRALAAIALRRLWTQRLIGPRFESVAGAVSALGAVQAQDFAGGKWALGQRTAGTTDAEVNRLYDEGAILRTHVMRPTWHFVTPADIVWMQELTASRVKALMAPYERRLEIDAPLLKRAHAAIARALRGGVHLTRAEIGDRLEKSGISASGQRLAQILLHAELDALVASGRLRGKQFTYALFAERAPGARRLDRDEALAELVVRFFASHGPAKLGDFAWWSGLTVTDGRRGLEAAGRALVSEVMEGKTYWWAADATAPQGAGPFVHLLPNYDELLIAYRDRSALLDPATEMDGASLIANVVTVDGRVVGGWKRVIDRGKVVVELAPVPQLSARAARALDDVALELSRFLGLPVSVASSA